MKKLEVYVDSSKRYYSATEALEDMGFELVGKVAYQQSFKWVEKTAFKKDSKMYAFMEMEHENTLIHNITLGDLDTLKQEYVTVAFRRQA